MEQTRPGQYFDITETEKGTYILNANDLCMAEHIADLVKAGVSSLKIEGRAKSHYYTAVTANAYRGAIDAYYANPTASVPNWVTEELNKISHRPYSKGFYFGRPENAQTYASAGYVRDYCVAGIVQGYQNGRLLVEVKNKFLKGAEMDCLPPRQTPFIFTVDELYDDVGTPIDSAPHPARIVQVACPKEVPVGTLLRMQQK